MNAIDFFKEEDPGNNDEYSKDTRNWLYDKNDMVMFAERYHQAKLKLLGIANSEERNKQCIYECKVCGKSFSDELSLYEHYNEEHN